MIAPQHQNLVMSSFVLWLNNTLLQYGAYTNIGGNLYRNNPVFQGYTQYSAPYKPLVFDSSYSGPNVMTGVYVNNSFLTIGQSGFAGVDYLRGNVYFTGVNIPTITSISGNYSILDYNVLFPAPDIAMVFEGKMSLINRNKSPHNVANTGMGNSEISYPAIFVRNESVANEPFEFGGTDLTTTNIACYLFCDSQYSLDALRSVLIDRKTDYFSLLQTGEMPTTNINSLKTIPYNYNNQANLAGKIGSGNALWIKDINTTNFNTRGLFAEVAALPPDVYFGLIEFEVCIPRLT